MSAVSLGGRGRWGRHRVGPCQQPCPGSSCAAEWSPVIKLSLVTSVLHGGVTQPSDCRQLERVKVFFKLLWVPFLDSTLIYCVCNEECVPSHLPHCAYMHVSKIFLKVEKFFQESKFLEDFWSNSFIPLKASVLDLSEAVLTSGSLFLPTGETVDMS